MCASAPSTAYCGGINLHSNYGEAGGAQCGSVVAGAAPEFKNGSVLGVRRNDWKPAIKPRVAQHGIRRRLT